MNLTSKRLLAIAVAAMGVSILTASAADYAYDTFEEDDTWQTYDYWSTVQSDTTYYTKHATNGMSILDFKKSKSVQTDMGYDDYCWTSTVPGSEASAITNCPITWNTVTASMAVPGTNNQVGAVSSQNYLNLSTEGGVLSRLFSGLKNHQSKTVDATSLYVDTMIQFTASEDVPDVGSTDVQLALWINKADNGVWGASNLMVYCGGEGGSGTTNYAVAANIDPAKWYRLTVETATKASGYLNMFRIYLDGALLTNSSAVAESDLGGTDTAKCWFYGLASTGTVTLNQLAFSGTGAIDDLAISETLPNFGNTAAIELTLSWDSTIASVVQNGAAAVSPVKVTSGDTFVISTADWYCLTQSGLESLLPAGVTSTPTAAFLPATTEGPWTNISISVSGAPAVSTNVTLTAEKYTSAFAGGTITVGGNTVDSAKAATWATANGVSMAGFSSFYKQYLLNMASPTPETEAAITLAITDITYGSDTTTIKVQAKNGTTQIDLSTAINGSLAYQAAPTLSALSTATITKVTLSSDKFVNGIATVTVDMTKGQFFKAWIE